MSDEILMTELVQVIHSDETGTSDYIINLTLNYYQEAGQWVGFCEELGTCAFASELEQTQAELREAVELQLNGVEGITDVRDYLADNQVVIQPVKPSRQAGFAIV